MEPWAKTSLILCVFGFLKEFRPAEPYITQYMVGPWKNLTEADVNQRIYPVNTYSYLSLLLVVLLVTDLLRYKLVIVLGSVIGVLSSSVLISFTEVAWMQVMAFLGGFFYATDIAYFTYIYAKVDRKYFQKVTSYTQSAFLMGRFLSSLTGQVLVSTELLDYHGLNYISIGATVLATLWSLFLPSVDASIYFHKKDDRTLRVNASKVNSSTFLEKCARAYTLLWADFKAAYSNWYVLKWSIWWALAVCGFWQVYFYIQLLWENVATEGGASQQELQTMYNGGVEAMYTMIGAAAAFGCGWLRLNWVVLGEATLAGCAVLQGIALIAAAYATNIWVAYLGFIVFGVLYHTMFTIVNAEVAKHINEDSYGLIFGVNTFFALVFQTILTVVVAGEGGLALEVRTQFVVYGGYFVVLGAAFAVIAIMTMCRSKAHKQPLWLPRDAQPVAT